MRLRTTLFPLCLLFALCLAADADDTSSRFISAIDGDSLLVEIGGHSRQVRLIGVDAPERGQEYGVRAKREVMRRCYGKTLRLEFDERRKDRYGRLLAYVYCGDAMLNEEMVRAGLALAVRYPPDTRYAGRFEAAEREARSARRGFWLYGGLKTTPRQWRRAHGR